MKKYKILAPIVFAARSWNAGEEIEMSDTRAKKFLDARQIEPIDAPPSSHKKSASSQPKDPS